MFQKKRLSICLFFRAPLGGLQENVLSTAIAAIRDGWEVSVFCPAGRFIDEHLQPSGIKTFAVDYQSAASVDQARDLICCADVIHAHPGPSRSLALKAAEISGAPVLFTIHGAWFDGVAAFAQRFAVVICVSPAVLQAVSRDCSGYTRIVCIPNGVDTERFAEAKNKTSESGHIVVASRLDADKRVLSDTLIGLWEVQSSRTNQNTLRYTIAGHGTLQGELELAARRFDIQVRFAGWQSSDALACLYEKASAVIASGRGAMEALAAGCPTLALASAGAAEAFHASQLPEAARSNFGGFGASPAQTIEALFDHLYVASSKTDTAFAAQARNFICAHHDNELVNQQLIALYEQALEGRCQSGVVLPTPSFETRVNIR